jgi:hypothetical protein
MNVVRVCSISCKNKSSQVSGLLLFSKSCYYFIHILRNEGKLDNYYLAIILHAGRTKVASDYVKVGDELYIYEERLLCNKTPELEEHCKQRLKELNLWKVNGSDTMIACVIRKLMPLQRSWPSRNSRTSGQTSACSVDMEKALDRHLFQLHTTRILRILSNPVQVNSNSGCVPGTAKT